jgi:hypothetical protein
VAVVSNTVAVAASVAGLAEAIALKVVTAKQIDDFKPLVTTALPAPSAATPTGVPPMPWVFESEGANTCLNFAPPAAAAAVPSAASPWSRWRWSWW